MSRRLISCYFSLLIALSSCSQRSAEIVYKDGIFYGKNRTVQAQRRTQPNRQKTTNANAIYVEEGDTLYSIARRNKISTRALINTNSLRPPYLLKVNQELQVPSERLTHIVKSGDSTYQVANSYNISANDLISLNRLEKPYRLQTGQVLVLPYEAKRSSSKQVATARSKNSPTSIIRNSSTKQNFIWPVSGKIVSNFGPKSGGLYNDGINIQVPEGTPIKAAASGKVVYIGNELRGYGNLIIIRHDNGWLTAYAHSKSVLTKKGSYVKTGDVIASAGRTGNVKSSQLHFGLRKGRKAVDPQKYLHKS